MPTKNRTYDQLKIDLSLLEKLGELVRGLKTFSVSCDQELNIAHWLTSLFVICFYKLKTRRFATDLRACQGLRPWTPAIYVP